jgi:hypothetical protein
MAMVMLGIDLTNNVFALHGVKEAGQQYDAVARAAQQERAGTEADVVYWSIPCWYDVLHLAFSSLIESSTNKIVDHIT